MVGGGLAIVKDMYFSRGIQSYIIEADFEMENYEWQGIFGLAFLTQADGSFYAFQWNGYSGSGARWQVEKYDGMWTYLGDGVNIPAYNLGSRVRLKVEKKGINIKCYVDAGSGYELIYDITDATMPASGGMGIRTYGIRDPNIVRVDNLLIYNCEITPKNDMLTKNNIENKKFSLKFNEPNDNNKKTKQKLYVYPNPFKEEINIKFILQEEKEINIIIYNLDGKIVWKNNYKFGQIRKGENIIKLNCKREFTPLPSNGVYFLKLATNDYIIIKKIVKIN